jgi:hypothetical protein
MNNETHQNISVQKVKSKKIWFLDMLVNLEDTEVNNETVFPTKYPEHFIIHSSCGEELTHTMF